MKTAKCEIPCNVFFFQNEKYLELTAKLLDAKATASEAKQTGNKSKQQEMSKKIQQYSKGMECLLLLICCKSTSRVIVTDSDPTH